MSKKFFLEELVDELRSLGEHYEMDSNEADVFLLKPNEVSVFSDDLQKIVKEFVEKELVSEEEDEGDELDEGLDDIFWLDEDDELE